MSPRAGILVTGTEVVEGRVSDANGPWLASRLRELGVDPVRIAICGDRAEDVVAELRFMSDQPLDLIVTSGGLGPTADDLTAEAIASFSGSPLELDPGLEQRIATRSAPIGDTGRRRDPEALRTAIRKQARVPTGAEVIEPVGTAPGLVIAAAPGTAALVVLPGPPRELRSMWPSATRTEAFRGATGAAAPRFERVLRLFGVPESELAQTLRIAEEAIEGVRALDVITCQRDGEIELVVRERNSAQEVCDRLAELIRERHGEALFSTDGSRVDDRVAALLAGQVMAVAESCTGGLMAGRLSARPGASAYLAGGVVAYDNHAKVTMLGVEPALLERYGAVSPPVAAAMAEGALARFGADTAIAITGIAGPGGGTEGKPVGYVCLSAQRSDGVALACDLRLAGDREEVRQRSTTIGMHLLRRLLGDGMPSSPEN